MIEATRWFDRRFEDRLELGAFPAVVERLRGAPARVEEKLAPLGISVLTERMDGAWSIQENLGHLLDLEPLWLLRLEDLLSGAKELRVADLTNRVTHEARHNESSLEELQRSFRGARRDFVARLDALSEDDIGREAIHPRLGTPMRTIDLCRFVAEHDDHHLARMTLLARKIAP